MTTEELLQELSSRVSSGELSRSDVLRRLGGLPMGTQEEGAGKIQKLAHFSVTKMLYVLGAAIVVIGIIIFVAQIWEDIGAFGHILVTLGIGLLLAGSGSMLMITKPGEAIGSIFHFIGGIIIPGGTLVTLSEIVSGDVTLSIAATAFAALFGFYLALTFAHKRAVLTFFSIVNGTTFIYLLLAAIVEDALYWSGDIFAYLTMAIGASYLLLGHAFRDGWNARLIGILNFVGTAGFLGAAFSRMFDSTVWEMIFPLAVLGGLYLAIRLKSQGILLVSTLFLIGYVTYITSEYFADSVGWPIALVVLGFMFIGLGYASIAINKRYIKNS